MAKKVAKSKEENSVQELEEQTLIESDADSEEKAELGIDESDENEQEAAETKKVVGDVVDVPAEVEAINTDNETAKVVSEGVQKANNPRGRSKRYLTAVEQVDKDKKYPVDEAIELAKNTSSTKFEASVELHIKMAEKKGKKKAVDELARGIFHLPHGMGKTLNIVILDEAKIDEIAKTKKVDFDVAIATPDLMPKMGKIAKILGPKGKMPNPKTGTVTEDPAKVKEEIEKGKIEYKIDASNVIHQMIGKAGWDAVQLKENFLAIMQSLPKNRIQSVNLSTTMGPGIKVEW